MTEKPDSVLMDPPPPSAESGNIGPAGLRPSAPESYPPQFPPGDAKPQSQVERDIDIISVAMVRLTGRITALEQRDAGPDPITKAHWTALVEEALDELNLCMRECRGLGGVREANAATKAVISAQGILEQILQEWLAPD